MSKALSAAAILAAEDHERHKVEVPAWGGHVYVRTISGADRDRFEAETFRAGTPNYQNLRARYLALVLCDKDGKLLFSQKDIDKLGQKSASALDQLFTEAAKINAMSKDDVDELVGNSSGDPSADSSSG